MVCPKNVNFQSVPKCSKVFHSLFAQTVTLAVWSRVDTRKAPAMWRETSEYSFYACGVPPYASQRACPAIGLYNHHITTGVAYTRQ